MQTRTALASLVLSLLASAALAGPLTPPAGPVASTMKTLDQVEPRTVCSPEKTPGSSGFVYVISQPGSYYLAGNVVPTGSNSAINIAASDVTLDLSGFNVTSASTSIATINISGDRVRIHNGSVACTGLGNRAVMVNAGSEYAVLDHLRVTASITNLSACIGLSSGTGTGNIVVSDCVLVGGNFGIWALNTEMPVTVRNTEVSGYSGSGLLIRERGVVENCTIRDAVSGASYGIQVGEGSVVRHTSVVSPLTSTAPNSCIYAGGSALIENCYLDSRGASALYLSGDFCTVRHNTIRMTALGSVNGVHVLGSSTFVADNHIKMNGGTGINLNGNAGNTVVRNYITSATTAIVGNASSIVGPIASNGNPTASTNPHANFAN